MLEWDTLTPFERRVALHRDTELPPSFYKYRGIPGQADRAGRQQLEDLLLRNGLWMADAATFNDPFEGRAAYVVPYSGAQLRKKWELKYRELGYSSSHARALVKSDEVAHPERLIERAEQALRQTLARMGMCALSANPRSPLLWSHYADSHRGICVQLKPYEDLNALLGHPIEYSDTYPVLSDLLERADQRDVLPMLRKSPDWAYEEEWRLVEQGRSSFLRTFEPRAMTAVILGMRVNQSDRAYIEELMEERRRRYGVRPTVYEAQPHPRRYRIRVRRL